MVTTAVALGVTAVVLVTIALAGAVYTRGRIGSVEDYISARNSAGSGTLTATLIASGMGAWILFSPAEAGAGTGITAALGYGLGSAAPMALYVAVGPRVRELMPEGHTLTEYAYARFGPVMYAYVLLVSVAYMFIFLAADLTAIVGALGFVAGVPAWQTALLVGTIVLAYTTYGGLQASMFTDTIQALLILPLLALTFGGAVFALGGPATLHAEIVSTNPSLLDPGFVPGMKFGAALIFAILGAEMLNQSWWQRIYAAENERTLRRAFAVTAVTVVPIVLVSGLAGMLAAGLGIIGENAASNAYLLLIDEAFSTPVTLAVVVLVTGLVMSTLDTLFNALSSIVTADLPRLLDDPDRGTLTRAARGLTLVAGVGAMFVSVKATSVLNLFLLADLLAASVFVPLLYGLYSERATEGGSLVASVVALVVGLLFFPQARGWASGLIAGDMLPAASTFRAFVLAVVVSAVLTVVLARVSTTRFDLGQLESAVRTIDERRTAADGGREVTD